MPSNCRVYHSSASMAAVLFSFSIYKRSFVGRQDSIHSFCKNKKQSVYLYNSHFWYYFTYLEENSYTSLDVGRVRRNIVACNNLPSRAEEHYSVNGSADYTLCFLFCLFLYRKQLTTLIRKNSQAYSRCACHLSHHT